jgi:hypothetical protein
MLNEHMKYDYHTFRLIFVYYWDEVTSTCKCHTTESFKGVRLKLHAFPVPVRELQLGVHILIRCMLYDFVCPSILCVVSECWCDSLRLKDLQFSSAPNYPSLFQSPRGRVLFEKFLYVIHRSS